MARAFEGYNVVVTGSTSGIGQSIAEHFATRGANIVLNGFGDVAAIEALRLSLESRHGIKAMYHNADMSDYAQVERMAAATHDAFGHIDALVNNAGVQYVAPLEDFPVEQWQKIIAVNLSAAFYAMKAFLPNMQRRNFGRIVNVASAHGLVASANKAAYVAAKHGLMGLTKVAALENAERDLTVNAVCPGWVETPLVKKQIEDRAALNHSSYEEEAIKLVGEKHPNKRFNPPDAVAEAVAYFARRENKYCTGTHLSVDGGWTAQ
ncbi:MAG: 3-hydroxybutyrate dehydrogenase [Rickettsiales bacterium]